MTDSAPSAIVPTNNAVITEDDDVETILYDPAEYRWVPVRRRPRHDGWTEEKQRRFIETLADTGQVRLAAEAVGMTRESAYKLRRSPHARAFAAAWDAARHHAGCVIEDVAFERALEGVEVAVFDKAGVQIATRRKYNDRLLVYLLRHLKPERYARDALATPALPPPPVDTVLRAMEPALPAPAEALLEEEVLVHELRLADAADGELSSFLREQRRPLEDAPADLMPPAERATFETELARAKAAAADPGIGYLWEGPVSGENFV